ncbi:hypothetical protein ACFOUO_15265 [Salinithrix halophila]|uniref:Uncharacterized protein n=1 Tax=Salinithrix halophila TaxID=1485204 RepID=A0ABV8JJP1_9BACL
MRSTTGLLSEKKASPSGSAKLLTNRTGTRGRISDSAPDVPPADVGTVRSVPSGSNQRPKEKRVWPQNGWSLRTLR